MHLAAVQSCKARDGLLQRRSTPQPSNRLAFFENIAIENARVEREDFSSLDDQPGTHVLVAGTGRYSLIGGAVKFVVGRSPERLKEKLEQATVLSERYYGLFRSARQSISPVEEFMHLYHILLMLFNDRPGRVEILFERRSDVPLTPDPHKDRE